MTMYELSAKQAELTEMLIAEAEEHEGVIPEELLNEMLDCDKDIDKKVESCAKAIRIIESEADLVDAQIDTMTKEIARLEARRNSIAKGADRLKSRVVQFMAEVGKDKVKTPLFTVYPKTTVSVNILDADKLPVGFRRQNVKVTYEPDKKLIKETIQSGQPVDGAELVETTRLQIR